MASKKNTVGKAAAESTRTGKKPVPDLATTATASSRSKRAAPQAVKQDEPAKKLPAKRAKTEAVETGEARALTAKKAAAKAGSKTATTAAGKPPAKAAATTAAKTAAKTAKKPARAAVAEAAVEAPPKAPRKTAAKKMAVKQAEPKPAEKPVAAARKTRAKAPVAQATATVVTAKPARTKKPVADKAPEPEVSKTDRTARKSAASAAHAELPEADATQAKPRARSRARTEKEAPVVALVAELAQTLIPQAVMEEPPAPRARGRRKPEKEAVVPVEAAVASGIVPAVEARQPSVPSPAWRWQRLSGPGLFGRYRLESVVQGETVELQLKGSRRGYLHCSCETFADSERGDCEHVPALLEALRTEDVGNAERLERGVQQPWSEVWLSAGWERRLVLHWGVDAPAELRDEALGFELEEGCLMAAAEGPALEQLRQAAAACGHELRIDAAVWQQRVPGENARSRVQRLAAFCSQGFDTPALQGLVKAPLADFQWEAALFSVSAGRALLAEASPLPQRAAALAAWAVWQHLFGLAAGVVVAPVERHEGWRREAERLLGAWPQHLALIDTQALSDRQGSRPPLLIVDAIQDQADHLLNLHGLRATQLLLISDQELLGEPLLAVLAAWLDEDRRGPLARLMRLGESAGKREQREVLQTLMLARQRRELEAQLPAALETTVLLEGTASVPDVQVLASLRALQDAWRAQGTLDGGQQLALQQALLQLRTAAEQHDGQDLARRQAEALLKLLPEALSQVERVVVFAQRDETLRALSPLLSDAGWSLANLRRQLSREVREAELAAWREGDSPVLLATDASCAGLDLQGLRTAVVHADLPWNPALSAQRLQRVSTESRGLQVWQLLDPTGWDLATQAAQAGQEQLPSGLLDHEPGASPFVGDAALPVLMAAVDRALAHIG